jgi:hypothetical protein
MVHSLGWAGQAEEIFTCVIVVHELYVNDNDLYAVVMNGLVVSHVYY